MDRYLSEPLTLSPSTVAREFTGADVVFYGVEHRGRSFEGLLFLNAPDANLGTPRELDAGFAGSFAVFGHGGCFGDEGHCKVPPGPRDPFDSRPPHGLTPQVKMVDVTDALKHPRIGGETLTLTVLPMCPGPERAELADVLFFTELRLLTYR